MAGALFGPGAGTALVSISATAGATAAFLIARYAARPLVASALLTQPRFRAVDAAVGAPALRLILMHK